MLLVTAGVIFREGKILITQRPPGKSGALKWEFPGGKLEPNEDPKDCLIREVREELGIEIRIDKILDVVFHRYTDFSVLLLFYRCDWISGEAKPLAVHALEWIEPARLTTFDFLEADLEFIRSLSKS